jgi:hypothetical protein
MELVASDKRHVFCDDSAQEQQPVHCDSMDSVEAYMQVH